MSKLLKKLQEAGEGLQNVTDTINGITGKNVITVYSVLLESGVKFTKEDSNRIGIAVAKVIKGGEKIKQLETFGEKSFTESVRPYTEEQRETIEEIISNYYANKTIS